MLLNGSSTPNFFHLSPRRSNITKFAILLIVKKMSLESEHVGDNFHPPKEYLSIIK